jgi:hypothetical protein
MLCRVALVRTDFSEERIASIIWVTRIGGLGTLAVTSNRSTLRRILVTLMIEAIHYSETLVHTRATRRDIPEDGILHSYRSEKLKSYIILHDSNCYLRSAIYQFQQIAQYWYIIIVYMNHHIFLTWLKPATEFTQKHGQNYDSNNDIRRLY